MCFGALLILVAIDSLMLQLYVVITDTMMGHVSVTDLNGHTGTFATELGRLTSLSDLNLGKICFAIAEIHYF
jgi:hypothetical protein